MHGRQLTRKPGLAAPMRRLAGKMDVPGGVTATGASSDREIKFIFSNEDVGRDNHVIKTSGCQLGNFFRNPVALWAHDSSAPPVGSVTSLLKSGAKLKGSIEFAGAATYPFADTVYRLYRGGFLNAVSVGWLPIEWQASKDRSRHGGLDFLKVEMLEVSCAPVPGLPTALAEARARGIVTRAELDTLNAKTPLAAREFREASDRRKYARQLADDLLAGEIAAALDAMPNGGRGARLETTAVKWLCLIDRPCLTGEREAELQELGSHLRRLVGLA